MLSIAEELLRISRPGTQVIVKGWRGAGGRGRCHRCGQIKLASEFATATGRVCIGCTTDPVRDVRGRFTKQTKEIVK